MGLHFLLPAAAPRDPRAVVGRAYARLGWVAAPAAEAATRSAILCGGGPGEFASVYDSAPAQGGSLLLRGLAGLITKTLSTTAIVTSLREDEGFEFILYRHGRQIDAALGEADLAAQGLACVRGRQQAHLWYEALGHHRFMALTEPAEAAPERIARFMAMAGQAAGRAGNARVALSAWCQLAGLAPTVALRGFEEAVATRGKMPLLLAAAPGGRRAAAKPEARVLTPHVAPEIYPYQAFFPAAWPVTEGAPCPFSWPVLLRGGGLSRLRVALHLDRTGPVVLEKITVSAFGWHNGEVVSATPLASWGQTVPEEIGATEGDLAFDADPLTLRAPDSEAAAYLLVVRVDVRLDQGAELFITPSLRADRVSAPPVMLPALRLRATPKNWVPQGADPRDANPVRQDALLRLNAPSVHTAVAILPDTGDDVRASARGFMEQFLQPIVTTKLVATIETQKHIGGDFSVTKTRQVVAMESLLQTPVWARLFETERGLQSVRIGIGLADAPAPLAGMVVETSLRNERGEELGQTRFSGPSLAVAFWNLAEDGALAALRVDMRAAREAFAAWVRASGPLQAWAADCAWIPAFDQYDNFAMTPYESASPVDWFGDNLVGNLTDRAWLRRHLRFVAPRLWLGWELAEMVDARQLTGFAHVTQYDDGLQIVLRDKRHLPLLEYRLTAILPGAR